MLEVVVECSRNVESSNLLITTQNAALVRFRDEYIYAVVLVCSMVGYSQEYGVVLLKNMVPVYNALGWKGPHGVDEEN
jgi:hypothetical protein